MTAFCFGPADLERVRSAAESVEVAHPEPAGDGLPAFIERYPAG